MCSDNIPPFVVDQMNRLEVLVTGKMLGTLSRYLDRLLDANRHFNLTGIRQLDEAWQRHVIDSLTLLAFLEDVAADAKLIDVGSGGGVPGIPVAVARPDLHVTLLEATGKKAAFCQQCVDELPLPNVRVIPQRAESIGQQHGHRQAYDVAVCRAIGSMRELLEYTLPMLRVGGRLLAMKGPKAKDELEQSADAMAILGGGDLGVYDAYPSGFEQGSVIVVITKASATPRQYPRTPGTARRLPL